MLHPHVVFVGDRPSVKRCLSIDVAFVGAPSYKTLLEWIYRMNIDINHVTLLNAYTVEGQPALRAHDLGLFSGTRIVTLGAAAAELVRDLQEKQLKPLKVFNLPHPSGLNRELNDKKKLGELLTRCREFVYKD